MKVENCKIEYPLASYFALIMPYIKGPNGEEVVDIEGVAMSDNMPTKVEITFKTALNAKMASIIPIADLEPAFSEYLSSKQYKLTKRGVTCGGYKCCNISFEVTADNVKTEPLNKVEM